VEQKKALLHSKKFLFENYEKFIFVRAQGSERERKKEKKAKKIPFSCLLRVCEMFPIEKKRERGREESKEVVSRKSCKIFTKKGFAHEIYVP
jgi:hypothetical protein